MGIKNPPKAGADPLTRAYLRIWVPVLFQNWGAAPLHNPLSRPPVEVPKYLELTHKPQYRNEDYLRQKYVVEGYSCNEISELLTSSRSTVLKHLKRAGIPIRHADQKTKSRIGFGEAWRNRQVVAHQRELELIQKMQNLRKKKLSYWKIAEMLNAWGIPTKTRKGSWSAKQVHQILARVEKVAYPDPLMPTIMPAGTQ